MPWIALRAEVKREFKTYAPNPWIVMALMLPSGAGHSYRGSRARKRGKKQKARQMRQLQEGRRKKGLALVKLFIRRAADQRRGKPTPAYRANVQVRGLGRDPFGRGRKHLPDPEVVVVRWSDADVEAAVRNGRPRRGARTNED